MAEPWTIKAILDWAQIYLRDRGFDTPRLDAELILGFVLQCKRIDLYLRFDQILTDSEQKQFGSLFRRRVAGEPVAYILGYKEFMGLRFKVTPQVLIPRPDTEILAERASSLISEGSVSRVLDVGTGSGALAICLAVRHPLVRVEAWDISQAALEVAQENATALGVGDRVQFVLKNALLDESWESLEGFDMIVSNPPYIRREERPTLPKSVKDFEPETALFANDEGLEFYRMYARVASGVMQENAALLMEIGFEQAADVKRIFSVAPWAQVVCHQDYGKRDRVCEVRYAELGKSQ